MIEVLEKDKELIAKERECLNAPKPTDFENGRITPEDVTKLIQLLQVPFEEGTVIRRERGDFVSKGVPQSLQLTRLFEVFGANHVSFEHKIVEFETVKREGKTDMHYYKVYVKLSIGNWTLYVNQDNKPCSTFQSYYEIEGIGFGGHTSKGTAEKNSVANGKKECMKNLGVLAYLYLEGDYSSDICSEDIEIDEEAEALFSKASTYPRTKLVLLDTPNMIDKGSIFLKGKAKDIQDSDKEVEIIIYRENPQLKEDHNTMIEALKTYKSGLVAGKELQVEYKEGNVGRAQYVIRRIFFNKSNSKDNNKRI